MHVECARACSRKICLHASVFVSPQIVKHARGLLAPSALWLLTDWLAAAFVRAVNGIGSIGDQRNAAPALRCSTACSFLCWPRGRAHVTRSIQQNVTCACMFDACVRIRLKRARVFIVL